MKSILALLIFALPALAAAPPSVPSQPVLVKRVADAAAWKKLRDRALKAPHVSQSVTVNGVDYTIFSIVSGEPFPGQQCPAGTMPRNAAHFTIPATGADAGIYPVRLTAACVVSPDDSSSHDLLSVDADADGKILDISFYDASLGLSSHPTAEPVPVAGDTQTSNLASVLGRLVKHLAAAP